jgi:hypothetical protein
VVSDRGRQFEGTGLRMMAHPVVDNDQCGHGLDNGNGSGQDARVVAAASHEPCRGAGGGDGFLLLNDGGGGFESGAERENFAGRNASQHPSSAVGTSPDLALPVFKQIVVGASSEKGSFESTSDLKAFGCRQGQHGLGEISLKPIKNRFAQAGSQAMTPPTLSPWLRTALMRSIMRAAVFGLGHLTAVASTSFLRTGPSGGGMTISSMDSIQAIISMLAVRRSNFAAIAPAATRPMVSRAEERPPPSAMRRPYFAS